MMANKFIAAWIKAELFMWHITVHMIYCTGWMKDRFHGNV